jgi:DNA polymerase-3 subunit delta
MTVQTPSITLIKNYLSKETLLPIFFLCGDDSFAIDKAVEGIKEAVKPLLESEFDFENYSMDKKEDFDAILNSASAFPFGSGKKLIIVKHFEKVSDKKKLTAYVKEPSESTVLVVAHYDRVKNTKSQPFAELLKKKFFFQTPYLRGGDLVSWLSEQGKELGISLGYSEAQLLIDTVGNDKTLLESQLQKFREYLNGKGRVTAEIIQKLSFSAKGYTIFDFLNVLGKGDKKKSVEILYNLLDNGTEMVYVNVMISKFIQTLAKALEIAPKIPDTKIASKKIGVSEYYYKNCLNSKYLLNEKRIKNAAHALLEAELNIKTKNMEGKTIGLMLVSDILS